MSGDAAKKDAKQATPAPATATTSSGAKDAKALSSKDAKMQAEMLKLITGMQKLNPRDLQKIQSGSVPEKEFKFWSTQPVPKLTDKVDEDGPIEAKTVEDIQKEPYKLPANFSWCVCDMKDPATVDEVYNLLSENYVEDDDNMFRFDYSREFLQWALLPPHYLADWHVGVRFKSTPEKPGKLMGFISGVPASVRVYKSGMKMVEINFLCVHKSLRSKRLAPVLIKEITRRVQITGIFFAVYTAGVVLPKPVAQNRYWHRSLNPKKLIDVQFSRLPPKMTMAGVIKLYKVPQAPVTPGIRAMEAKDAPAACALLNEYMKKFDLVQEFSVDEFAHFFLPRENVIYSYVVEDPTSRKITDMLSFYCLPSTIIGHPQHKTLRAAYSFYNVATKAKLVDLMNDALTLARAADFDVFNCLDVMENESFLKPLKFGPGDGHLQYYLYNWKCPSMTPAQVGLVLL